MSGASGDGIVLRDADREVLFAASIFFGHTTNIHVEILALEKGLQLCHSKGYRRMQINTDSMILVQMLHGQIEKP